MTERTNRQIAIRLKISKLRQSVSIEVVDFRHSRGLDRSLLMALSDCSWISRHDNCLLTGPTGDGKTFLACALAAKACREGYKVTYERTSRLLESLAVARAEGSYARRLAVHFGHLATASRELAPALARSNARRCSARPPDA